MARYTLKDTYFLFLLFVEEKAVLRLLTHAAHCLTPTCDLWTAGYRVADLFLLRFGVEVTRLAVSFVRCQTSDFSHL